MLIIAISGVTNGGKTTVAKALQNALPKSILISQDTYFLSEDSDRHTLIPEFNHFNWEILSSLDMDKMWEDINFILGEENPFAKDNTNYASGLVKGELSTNKGYTVFNNIPHSSSEVLKEVQALIIEGFLVLNEPRIAGICDLKYHMTLSKEECYNRRKARQYNPPDVPGYFDACVWPEYVRHRDEMLQTVQDVKVVDGTREICATLNEILGDVVQRLQVSNSV